MDILSSLNDAQREAARHIDGAMLILAGAGSGKTLTITTRLAYLIGEIGIDPLNTLTLTFTNKAATQMKLRALNLIRSSQPSANPLLCTFHKFGLLFLKLYMRELNRANNFVIIDIDDKKKIIKEFENSIATNIVSNEISRYKNMLLSPEEIISSSVIPAFIGGRANYEKIAKAYKSYEEYLAANNLVDFDDLLCLTYRILDSNPALCNQISNRYKYITIDEYQDTNELQYKLLRKLCAAHENVVVVGDDDQSIYGWRGAKIENILNFKDQFSSVKVVRLEENYRSSSNILNAANELIDHNRNRLGKKLISTKKDNKDIEILQNSDEESEAKIISARIAKLINDGEHPTQIAILYRINALSRALEEGLIANGVPYKIVGGIKFYERAEIKDIISYLRLILNPHDDFSLERIINRPKRGLGKVGFNKLSEFAFNNKISLYEAILRMDEGLLGKKVFTALNELARDIAELREVEPKDLVFELENKFSLKEFYKQSPEGDDRLLNIDEFYGSINQKIENNPDFSLEEFLNDITLQSDQDRISEDAISIMSVHASKGLEFEHVFIIGLEEGFFPLISDECDIEEERRLGYVAITRAKSDLVLSSSNFRIYRGKKSNLERSRFLSEAGLISGKLRIESTKEFRRGDLIKHKIFGIGRVLEVTQIKSDFKLKINFGGNIKEIMSGFVEKV
ncbi:ATP-dependent helicase [Campylobacter sp.]|uniref:ATP-dependent helicase n=1 Tax=Campylobacter sp. TaxID=205 RepID=UPI002AA898DA|nr:UvrD-helicase domain-containing protein [Campylobacter sp.]MCI7446917.1 UvrD-helicase domain-containing protein [Campylobacter sp.]